MRTWVSLASERAKDLKCQAGVIDPRHTQAGMKPVWNELGALSWLMDPTPDDPQDHRRLKMLGDWWSGSAVQDVWMRLHWIEEHEDALRADTDDVVRAAQAHVEQDVSARKRLDDELRTAHDDPALTHAVALGAIRRVHRQDHQKHIDERQRNRAMVVFTGLLGLGAVLMLVLQASAFADTPFLVIPPGATIGGTPLLALVVLFGAVGGLISALVSLYLTTKVVDGTMWFDPRPAMSAVKVVLGAWTAFLGVLMVGTGLVVGVYTSVPSAIILAVLFGYGQQAVTGVLLDRNVGKLTEGPTG